MSAVHRGGSGPPMVLLHGFTDTWRGWTPILGALEARHDVLAATLPGHHDGAPLRDGEALSMDALVGAVTRRMDEAGFERAHLVGSSLGGWMALELAARGRALSVVALCPGGGWEAGSREDRATARYFRRTAALLRIGGPLFETIARRPRLRALALRELVAHPERIRPTPALEMVRGAAGCAVVDELLTLSRSGALFGDLDPIDCRVRIAYGTADRIVRWPSHYARLRALLPDAEYVALEGLGHLPMWDDPERVARVVLEVSEG